MDKAMQIRTLNDQFRQTLTGGRVVVTSGLADRSDVLEIVNHVRTHSEFTKDNDPYGEHDFGAFKHAGEQLFWKIDYYDSDFNCGSPDPADPAVTTRVLTIMLACEY